MPRSFYFLNPRCLPPPTRNSHRRLWRLVVGGSRLGAFSRSSLLLVIGPGDPHVNVLQRMPAARQLAQRPAALAHQRENLRAQVNPAARRQGAAMILSLGRRHVELFDFTHLGPT